MAETPTPTPSNADTETHFVEIPMDSGNNDGDDNDGSTSSQQCLVAHHPKAELSESPGHLLLLSLYRRDEDRVARRVGLGEARLDDAKREALRHSSLFLAFHSLFLTLLFAASAKAESNACRKWWLPSCLSMLTSCVLTLSVQVRVCQYWRVRGQLGRDRRDERTLRTCIQELRLKGTSYDLSRELQATKRPAKCSSVVHIKWRPRRWLSRNLVTVCMLVVAALLVLACKPLLCS